jgi:VWFA-related protein
MQSLRAVAVSLLICSLNPGVASSAAAQAPATTTSPTVSSRQDQPEAILRTNAFSVLVDVVVTDQNAAVHGIDSKRFHVYENGREQSVTYFEEHRPNLSASPQKRRTMPPHYYNNLPANPPSSAVNVLLLDGLNTPLGDQAYVRKQMMEYVKTIAPGTTLAIFTLASRLRMVQGFTSNIDDLVKALDSARTLPQQSVALDSGAGNAFDSAIGNLVMMGAPALTIASIQGFESDVVAMQTDRRVQITLEAIQQLARYLSAVPGRKNLIWFSASFPIALGPDPGNESLKNSRNYADQVRATSDLLSAARVAVYPVDAKGMMSLPGFDVSDNGLSSTAGGDGTPSFARSNAQAMTGNTYSHFSMEQIAGDTGGKAFFNTNGFKAAIASAITNGESYYTIGYVPESKEFNGDFRKIKVKLDSSKYDLEYRSGYYADPPGKGAPRGLALPSLMATATQHGAPLSTQVLFQTRVLPTTDPEFKDASLPAGPAGDLAPSLKGTAHRYVVDVAVDPRTLVFDFTTTEARTASIEFTLVVYDADGKRVNYIDRAAQLAVNPEQYAQIMKSGLPVRMEIDAPAGEGTLRIAVHDRLGARVGSLEIPLTVGDK